MIEITLPDFQRMCVKIRIEKNTHLKFNNIASSNVRVGMCGFLFTVKRRQGVAGKWDWIREENLGEFRILDGRPKFQFQLTSDLCPE